MRSLLDWLAYILRGPPCPYGCGHRTTDPYARACHETIDHCGDADPAP